MVFVDVQPVGYSAFFPCDNFVESVDDVATDEFFSGNPFSVGGFLDCGWWDCAVIEDIAFKLSDDMANAFVDQIGDPV